MGSTLFGQQIKDSYEGLIKTSDSAVITGTAKYLSDGLGNDSALSLTTTQVGVGTNFPSEKLHVDGSTLVTYNNSFQSTNSIGNKAILARVSPTVGIINYAEYATAANLNGFVIGSDDARVKGNIAGDSLQFITNASTRMTILSSGNVGINTTSPANTLDVTGSIRASEGILFGTDTAPANTLDDYEEGTFTPSVYGSISDGSATYSDANGNYTKIGRAVHFEIYLSWTAGTGTGKLRIAGLPYVINNPGAGYTFPAFTISLADITLTAGTIAGAEGIVGSQDITVVELPVGGGPRSGADYNAAGLLVISGTYFA
jgi:hypothetical protein